MNRLCKNLLISLSVFLVLGFLTLLFVGIFFDPLIRQVVLKQVNQKSKFQVEIGGLELKVLGGLAIEAKRIIIHSPQKDRLLFAARKLYLKVDFLPLLSKKVVVSRARIEESQIYIYQKSASEQARALDNPAYFTPILVANKLEPSSLAPWQRQVRKFLDRSGFILHSLELEKATLVLVREKNNRYTRTGVHISLRVALEYPDPDSPDLVLDSIEFNIADPKNITGLPGKEEVFKNSSGIEDLGDIGSHLQDIYGHPIESLVNNEPMSKSVRRLLLDGAIRIKGLVSENPWLEIDLKTSSNEDITLEWLRKLLSPSSQHLLRKTRFTGNLLEFSLQAKAPVNDLQDTGSLIRTGSLKTSLVIEHAHLVAGDVQFPIPRIESKGVLNEGRLSYKFGSDLLGGKFSIQGDANAEKETPGKLFSSIILKVLVDKIDIAHLDYRVLRKWVPVSGQASASLELTGFPGQVGGIRLQSTLEGSNFVFNAPVRGTGKFEVQKIRVPEIKANAAWDGESSSFVLNCKVLGGEVHIDGKTFLDNKSVSSKILVDSHINVTNVSLDGTKPLGKGDFSPIAGTFSGEMDINGPLNIKALNFSGKLVGENLLMGVPKQRHKADRLAVKFQTDSKKNKIVQLDADQFSINNFMIRKLSGKLTVTPVQILLNHLNVALNQGVVEVKGAFLPKNKEYGLTLKGEGLSAEELTKSYFWGSVQFKGALTGDLHGVDEGRRRGERIQFRHIAKGMSGEISARFSDGGIKKMKYFSPLFKESDRSVGSDQDQPFPFNSLSGRVEIRQGVASSKNIVLEKSGLRVKGSGEIDFYTNELRGEIRSTTTGGKVSLFKAGGTYLEPTFKPLTK